MIAEKLTKINETWKDVWPRLDLLEASCESLKEEIKRKVSRKVAVTCIDRSPDSFLYWYIIKRLNGEENGSPFTRTLDVFVLKSDLKAS